MTRISIELVPRDEADLTKDLEQVKELFPTVDTINIPDLLRMDVRSWEGCSVAQRFYTNTIPHIRAIDFPWNERLPLIDYVKKAGFKEVLVVTGDPPQDLGHKIYRTSALDMIKKFKEELPEVKVYGALDPYRSSFRKEYDYLMRKQDAGCDGFFTQPFFDLRLMEVYQEIFSDIPIFWGASPVMTDRSRNYWEIRNNALFPKDFQPTMEWNRNFAARALAFAQETGGNIYFMPIRVDLKKYLEGIL